jgi:carboxylesterase
VTGESGGPSRRRRAARGLLTGLAVVAIVLAALAGFVLLKPVAMPAAGPGPDPAATHEEAIARFTAIEQREAGQDLLPVCRSKLLDRGARAERVVVLLHGYTNCPEMFERLGEELFAAGYSVLIPLAPEHGETDREHSTLSDLTAGELIAYGNEAVDIAAGLGDEVIVVGLSGGGSVAAHLAQFRDDVDLAVPIAPFLGLRSVPAPLTSALVNLADLLPPIAWGIPESMASGGAYAPYAGLDNNTRSAAAYMRLGRLVLDDAARTPHRAATTVTVVNEGDDTVNNALVDDLTARWRTLAPGATGEHRFPASLALPHDLIGPDRVDEQTSVTYPVILDILARP